MKNLGYILIAAAFLGGAYLTSLDERIVEWGYFSAWLILGFIGVAIVRISSKQAAHADDKISDNIALIKSSLENLVKNVSMLNAQKQSIHTYDMHTKVDELLLDDLDAFAEARETIAHKFGLHAYADIMNHFAGGERYLNRVWSASADGYIDEVNEYIGKAQEQFVEAQKQLKTLMTAK